MLGVASVACRPDLDDVFARVQLVERYGVHAFVGTVPFSLIDAVLETDVVRVLVIQQGELQGEGILRIWNREALGMTVDGLAIH